jgi:pimeloyl-ACP methyl ester carboxylesterase
VTRTFLLAPGAVSSGWYWHRVVPLLEAAGSRAVAPDLPSRPGTTLNDQVETLVKAAASVTSAESTDIVVVGQSLAGFCVPQAAQRLQAQRLVLLNAMIALPGETPGQWWDAVGQDAARAAADREAGRDPDAGFDDETYFLHDVPAEVLASAPGDPAPPPDSVFASTFDLPRWPDVPTTVVAGVDDRFFPVAFQERVARDRLGLDVIRIPGGHLAALSHPAEVVAVLLA